MSGERSGQVIEPPLLVSFRENFRYTKSISYFSMEIGVVLSWWNTFCLDRAQKILKLELYLVRTFCHCLHAVLAVPDYNIMSVNMRGKIEDVSSLNTLLTVKKIFPSFLVSQEQHSIMCNENFCFGMLHDATTGVWIKSDVS